VAEVDVVRVAVPVVVLVGEEVREVLADVLGVKVIVVVNVFVAEVVCVVVRVDVPEVVGVVLVQLTKSPTACALMALFNVVTTFVHDELSTKYRSSKQLIPPYGSSACEKDSIA